jgi:hypothetical protein
MWPLTNTPTRTSNLADCPLLTTLFCSSSKLHCFVSVIPLCIIKIRFEVTSFNITHLSKYNERVEGMHFGFLPMPLTVNIWHLYIWTVNTAVRKCKLNCVCAYYKVQYSKLIFCKMIHWNIFIINSFITISSPAWHTHCQHTITSIFTTTKHTVFLPITLNNHHYTLPGFHLKTISSLRPHKSHDFTFVTQSEHNDIACIVGINYIKYYVYIYTYMYVCYLMNFQWPIFHILHT